MVEMPHAGKAPEKSFKMMILLLFGNKQRNFHLFFDSQEGQLIVSDRKLLTSSDLACFLLRCLVKSGGKHFSVSDISVSEVEDVFQTISLGKATCCLLMS